MSCDRTLPIVWLLRGRAELSTPPGCVRINEALTVHDLQKALLAVQCRRKPSAQESHDVEAQAVYECVSI